MTARTKEEIRDELNADINDVITSPSTSDLAEWKLWRDIFVNAIWIFEVILDAFEVVINTIIQTKQYGTFSWWYDRAFEFQGSDESGTFQGDALIVDDNGNLVYETTDETRRIIAALAITADGGVISFKVAKYLDEVAVTYQKLTTDEVTAFGQYINNIKYPGTQTNIISENADSIKYDIDIIYDPAYATSTIEAELLLKVDEYRQSITFEDKFYTQRFLEKLLEVDGVTTVDVTSLEGKEDAGSYAAIDIAYTIEAGYYNYDVASQFTYTDETTL